MLKFISKNAGILGLFAIITTGLIALTYWQTKDRIYQAQQTQLLSILNQLVPEESHDNALHTDCIIIPANPLLGDRTQRAYRARLEQQNQAIIIETTAPDGYSGDIQIVVAVDTQETVLGARVLKHKETPGLGDKIDTRVSDWIYGFAEVVYNEEVSNRWKVKKDGGQFDQFTGATITPRAVVRAIANAAAYVNQHQDQLYTVPANCEAPVENAEATDERI
ncbi:electron transport complex subunit RsxG [Glaciecola sp. 1036]|uniref:electron transport complex subunit RsxG n=1 Tax=Alteromonadaceae TaxID=72275 RepID=UPI003D0892D3